MRMGTDPSNSVLDASAEAHEVGRLFIADNSALANSLGGPNPTLTTQALATRTAEKIFVKYFGGQPFVGQETPISSIDDRVTRAVLGMPGSPNTAGRDLTPAPAVVVALSAGAAAVSATARKARRGDPAAS